METKTETETERRPLTERDDPGPVSKGMRTDPRGNQDTEQDDVDRGVDKLERVVNH